MVFIALGLSSILAMIQEVIHPVWHGVVGHCIRVAEYI
jgi:hypothetical protein